MLMTASGGGHTCALNALFEATPPPNVNARDALKGAAALHYVRNGIWEDFEEHEDEGELLLAVGTASGFARKLVERGADANARDDEGRTPMEAALRLPDAHAVAVLLLAGVEMPPLAEVDAAAAAEVVDGLADMVGVGCDNLLGARVHHGELMKQLSDLKAANAALEAELAHVGAKLHGAGVDDAALALKRLGEGRAALAAERAAWRVERAAIEEARAAQRAELRATDAPRQLAAACPVGQRERSAREAERRAAAAALATAEAAACDAQRRLRRLRRRGSGGASGSDDDERRGDQHSAVAARLRPRKAARRG